ncbi:hypothetical protein IAG25_30575 [Caballeronia sp. EK]|uniref:hypothetical protein n=1 Tax=Caballeronia sp. EK TaxID=2767469 RepID=UPI0016559BD4|nr:hypothetical protein [Caballeronia sp. EK]MBC8641169.1 hypothetical protein [Caballeronia sp. EK]
MEKQLTAGSERISEDCGTTRAAAARDVAATSTAKSASAAAQSDRRPNWRRWEQLSEVTVAEAVALSLDIDPELVDWGAGANAITACGESPEFNDRLFVAVRYVGIGKPLSIVSAVAQKPSIHTMIKMEEFVAWATKRGWKVSATLVDRFGEHAPLFDYYWDVVRGGGALPETSGQASGNYSTKLFRLLLDARDKYWVRYDADDPSTAPTNETVAEWLMAQGVSDRLAQTMATILRADDLPAGRRKK